MLFAGACPHLTSAKDFGLEYEQVGVEFRE
jgi:hypothetical protein